MLRPSDFYLQVTPTPRSPPRITVKCLAVSGQHVEELNVPELAYTSLFTMDWLESINRERSVVRKAALEHCLLSADNDIFRVPWEDIVHPEFISRPSKVTEQSESREMAKDVADKEGRDSDIDHEDNPEDIQCRIFIDTSTDQSTEMHCESKGVKLLPALSEINKDGSGQSSSSTAEDSEGEYVELADISLPRFSPQKGSLTQAISMNYRNLHKPQTAGSTQPKAKPEESLLKNGACSQSMVCAMLIEENLSDTYQSVILTPTAPAEAEHLLQQVDGSKSTSAAGTASCDSVSEHESERELYNHDTAPLSDMSTQTDIKPVNTTQLDSSIISTSQPNRKPVSTSQLVNKPIQRSQSDIKPVNASQLDNTLDSTSQLVSEPNKTSQPDVEPVSISQPDLKPLCISQLDSKLVSTSQLVNEPIKTSQPEAELVRTCQLDSNLASTSQPDSKPVMSQLVIEPVKTSQPDSKPVSATQLDNKLVSMSKPDSTSQLVNEPVKTSQPDVELVRICQLHSNLGSTSQPDSKTADMEQPDSEVTSTSQPENKMLSGNLESENSEVSLDNIELLESDPTAEAEVRSESEQVRGDCGMEGSCDLQNSGLSVSVPLAVDVSIQKQTEQTDHSPCQIYTHIHTPPEKVHDLTAIKEDHETFSNSSHDTNESDGEYSPSAEEEVGPVSAAPPNELVALASVTTVPGEDLVTLISQGQVRTESCEDRNNETEVELQTKEECAEREVVGELPCEEAKMVENKSNRLLESKTENELEVCMEKEVETAQTGLVDTMPKSVSDVRVQEEGGFSVGTDEKKQTNVKEHGVEKEETKANTLSEQEAIVTSYSENRVQSACTQVLDLASDVPSTNGHMHTQDTPTTEREGQKTMEEERKGEKEERQEDEVTSSVNGSPAEHQQQADMESHYHQQEEQGRVIFAKVHPAHLYFIHMPYFSLNSSHFPLPFFIFHPCFFILTDASKL